MQDLAGKVIIVTGASRGIGAAAAGALAMAGASLMLTARDGAQAESVAHAITRDGGKAAACACDVSDWNAVQRLVTDTQQRFGKIDALVNNAGVVEPIATTADSDPAAWARAIEINLIGAYYAIRAVLPAMIAAGGGTIVNVSSGAAHNPLEGWSAYCSGKAGLAMLTRAIALEHAAQGIRVFGFQPGTTDTDMQVIIRASGVNPISKIPRENLTPVAHPAAAIVYLCTNAADDLAGKEFSLRDEAFRSRLNLCKLENPAMPADIADDILDRARRYQDELTEFRRDIHAHPELGLQEHRTAEQVAKKLEALGMEVHRGVGKTGVVGVLRNGDGPAIGLRADMDALAMDEQTNLPYSSRNAGRMHACGHDGHTTMLLGAAKYLSDTRNFKGTVNFIFQPEEGAGGALAMLEDGLLERFPCESLFGMHNRPGMPVGQFGITSGKAMAGAAMFDIVITGKGGHGARPEVAIDPVVVACHLGTALQSIVSRNVPPQDMAILSICRIQGGEAYNVIPQTATMGGTVRTFTNETMALVEANMRRLAASIAAGFGAEATVEFRIPFVPLINDADHTRAFADAAAGLVGEAKVDRNKPPANASEDFSFMLEKVPGAYINIGNGEDSAPVHHPAYNFNDAAIPYGVALFASIVEQKLGSN